MVVGDKDVLEDAIRFSGVTKGSNTEAGKRRLHTRCSNPDRPGQHYMNAPVNRRNPASTDRRPMSILKARAVPGPKVDVLSTMAIINK